MWRSGLRECGVGAACHPGHPRRRLGETGAIITAETCQDSARVALSQVAPRCRLRATPLEKKSRRGDSTAASPRNVEREVAARHGTEETGFGLRMANTHHSGKTSRHVGRHTCWTIEGSLVRPCTGLTR